jgi:hypothetical protein
MTFMRSHSFFSLKVTILSELNNKKLLLTYWFLVCLNTVFNIPFHYISQISRPLAEFGVKGQINDLVGKN